MIKLFASDVDGTLTDGCMYYADDGTELKKFNFRDGMGFQLLREHGIKTAIITSETTPIVQKRADKLHVDYLAMGCKNKLEYMQKLCSDIGINLTNVAYIGDDINDMELLNSVGLAACPMDAVDAIKSLAKIHILGHNGGNGAVREFIDGILLNR